jgi:hypothetical protein
LNLNKLIVTIIFLNPLASIACDVCNIFEYTNRSNSSYAGIYYRNRMFNGYNALGQPNQYTLTPAQLQSANARMAHLPNSTDTYVNPTDRDYEYFQTIELRYNFNYKRNWNFQIILPYSINKAYYKHVLITNPFPIRKDSVIFTHGLGDVILLADYAFILDKNWTRHILRPGIALKLPTGKYQEKDELGQTLPYDLQIGTGSVDLMLRFNYLVTNDIWGLEVLSSVRYLSPNDIGIQFGSRFNSMTNLFYTFGKNSTKIIPKLGTYYEWADFDMVRGEKKTFSGGQSLYIQTGVDVLIKKFTLQILFQKPVYQKLNGMVVGNSGRFVSGLMYNF